jgi:Membrane bound O-acyl transferase family
MLGITHSIRVLLPESEGAADARRAWLSWIPLAVFPAAACSFRSRLAPWEFMWILSVAIFFGFKWETWFRARHTRALAGMNRNFAYLFLWPGMDAAMFLASGRSVAHPPAREWIAPVLKTLAGIALVGFVSRRPLAANGLLEGWIGMVGMVLFLHFGLFHLISLAWRTAGVDAQPIMRSPALSTSLGEFWGKRWNLGFRQLTHALVYEPIHRKTGPSLAILSAFVVSGIIHDLVVSFPARGGYGLPTSYFLVQGIGVLFEKSNFGRWLGIGNGFRGWAFTLLCTGGPAFWLFHPAFIHNVMLPFFAFLGRIV